MRPLIVFFAAGLILTGCASKQAGVGSGATTPPAAVRPATSAGADLAIALTDPLVRSAVSQFTSQGKSGTPFAAFRGTQEQFVKLGCSFGQSSQPAKVETVVYIKGAFTSPSGKASDTAMVQYTAPNAIATLYGTGATGAAAWCTPPGTMPN